jgi:hypothetical protein
MIHEIKAVCVRCDGSGLAFYGVVEPYGASVICHDCGGEGWLILRVEEFKERRLVSNVDLVVRSTSNPIFAAVQPDGASRITYAEFLRGVRP